MLIGHGSSQNADSGVPVLQHAAELRRRRIFAQVRFENKTARGAGRNERRSGRFWLTFHQLGYFSEKSFHRLWVSVEGSTELARVRQAGNQTLAYCRLVGSREHDWGLAFACHQCNPAISSLAQTSGYHPVYSRGMEPSRMKSRVKLLSTRWSLFADKTFTRIPGESGRRPAHPDLL